MNRHDHAWRTGMDSPASERPCLADDSWCAGQTPGQETPPTVPECSAGNQTRPQNRFPRLPPNPANFRTPQGARPRPLTTCLCSQRASLSCPGPLPPFTQLALPLPASLRLPHELLHPSGPAL
uniref:cDNA FLJ25996 fis, clone DMC06615 n=1 Tax=Homo sapiens TaxID=9606 RepID=Q6ZPD5_HUMAN|nr:Unknown (protein for MGC:168946) [Homo sapiens]BAC85170.1 unnamed protein product [Homo sapiens]